MAGSQTSASFENHPSNIFYSRNRWIDHLYRTANALSRHIPGTNREPTGNDIPSGEKLKIKIIEQNLSVWFAEAESLYTGWGAQHKNLSMKSLQMMDEALLTPLVNSLSSGQFADAEKLLAHSEANRLRTDPIDGSDG